MKKDLLFKVVAISIGILISLVAAEVFLRVQNVFKIEGFHNQNPWHEKFHHGDGSLIVREYGSNCENEKIKLLLLGDSWMIDEQQTEDQYLSKIIGSEFAEKTEKCVQTVNGSSSSYSPTLYLLKARQAYDTYGKFDYIIVNVDENDIGDEWLRYKIPTVRDKSGKIIAVPYVNDLHARYTWNGKLWAENSRFYVIRLLKFTFLYKALVPALYKFTFAPDYPSLMQYIFSPDSPPPPPI